MLIHYINRYGKKFIRQKTYSKGIGDLYQIDLADLSNLSSYNDGYRYLLIDDRLVRPFRGLHTDVINE